jgi:uncharacterized RDD family membrane protein YckC
MVWYYREGDLENGPVSKAELQTLVKSKQVSAQTLVRSIEMTDWVPLIDVVRGKTAQPQSPPPPADGTPVETVAEPSDDDVGALSMEEKAEASPGQVPDKEMVADRADDAASTAVCSQCGRSFPQDQVIAYDDQMICAACKPMFVQRLKEGVALPAAMIYGGFWIRFLAKMIDGIILSIAQWAVLIPLSILIMPSMMQTNAQFPTLGFFIFVGVQVLLGFALPLAYGTFFLGRFGATLGKMACRLKVVTPEGDKITYMRAFGRFWAEIISYLIMAIGYIMAAFDDEKRALHDRICSTRVVKKS